MQCRLLRRDSIVVCRRSTDEEADIVLFEEIAECISGFVIRLTAGQCSTEYRGYWNMARQLKGYDPGVRDSQSSLWRAMIESVDRRQAKALLFMPDFANRRKVPDWFTGFARSCFKRNMITVVALPEYLATKFEQSPYIEGNLDAVFDFATETIDEIRARLTLTDLDEDL